MVERILLLVGVGLLLWAGWALLRFWQARRVRTLAEQRPFAEIVPAGRPAVVAFSLPSCVECRTRQAPALRQLATQFGERVVVRTLSATEHPALVDQLGLLTVPATAVLDANGIIRHLNQGFADTERLSTQLQSV